LALFDHILRTMTSANVAREIPKHQELNPLLLNPGVKLGDSSTSNSGMHSLAFCSVLIKFVCTLFFDTPRLLYYRNISNTRD
jgi:hypothetical protein